MTGRQRTWPKGSTCWITAVTTLEPLSAGVVKVIETPTLAPVPLTSLQLKRVLGGLMKAARERVVASAIGEF